MARKYPSDVLWVAILDDLIKCPNVHVEWKHGRAEVCSAENREVYAVGNTRFFRLMMFGGLESITHTETMENHTRRLAR